MVALRGFIGEESDLRNTLFSIMSVRISSGVRRVSRPVYVKENVRSPSSDSATNASGEVVGVGNKGRLS